MILELNRILKMSGRELGHRYGPLKNIPLRLLGPAGWMLSLTLGPLVGYAQFPIRDRISPFWNLFSSSSAVSQLLGGLSFGLPSVGVEVERAHFY